MNFPREHSFGNSLQIKKEKTAHKTRLFQKSKIVLKVFNSFPEILRHATAKWGDVGRGPLSYSNVYRGMYLILMANLPTQVSTVLHLHLTTLSNGLLCKSEIQKQFVNLRMTFENLPHLDTSFQQIFNQILEHENAVRRRAFPANVPSTPPPPSSGGKQASVWLPPLVHQKPAKL